MITDELYQATLAYLEEFGPANLPDEALPSPIREMMVENGAYSVARIKDRAGEWALMLLSSREVTVAQETGTALQHYAELKAQIGQPIRLQNEILGEYNG